jgi:ligand-binding sensor domain-containing protein
MTVTTNGTAVFALALNPVNNDLWMGTEQYGIFRSTDNGAPWGAASPPDKQIDAVNGIQDGNIFAITFDRNGNVLFGSQGGIWKSAKTGSGFNWNNVRGGATAADVSALARDANGTLYYGHRQAAADPASLYCSTDDGNTWSACDSGMPQSRAIYRLVLNPADGRL